MIPNDYDTEQVVRELLKHGADVDKQDDMGHTALLYAAVAGNADIVKILLDYCASPDLRDYDGKTALDWAMDVGSSSVVELFQNYHEEVSRGNCYWNDMLRHKGDYWCDGDDELVCPRDCRVIHHPHPQLGCEHHHDHDHDH